MNKAQSSVIGFVLIFGIIVLLASIYQTTVVPTVSENTEFNSEEDVRDSMIKLDSYIQTAITTENSQVVRIGSNVNYIPSLLSIREDLTYLEKYDKNLEIRIRELSQSNGIIYDRKFETNNLRVQKDYNFYESNSVFEYENSFLFQHNKNYTIGSGNSVTVTGQKIINEDQINIITVNTSRKQSVGYLPVTVSPDPTKYESTTLGKSSDTKEIMIRLDTKRSEDKWRDMLEDELNSNNIESIDYTETSDTEYNLIEIYLDRDKQYDFERYHVEIE
jgi:hypothetical protein